MKSAFLNVQIRAFEALSHDRNPIHNDSVYARSTQFGRPIVYGMCGVLLGLARWAKGRSFRLSRIRGKFLKPLFESVEYELFISEDGSHVKVQYRERGIAQMSFEFEWENHEANDEQLALVQDHPAFQPLASAKDIEIGTALADRQRQDYSYSVRLESLPELLPELGLRCGQIPINQLNALMGSSYLVGMEIPGRQALYSGFEFEFEPASLKGDSGAFKFGNVSVKLDPRFNRISVSGNGTGMNSFALLAFQRPKPVRYGIEDIRASIPHPKAFKDAVIFISGGARGFGAVLAKMFAMQEAKIIVNYRSNKEDAEFIAAEVRPWNAEVFPVHGDVSNAEDCKQIGLEIGKRFGQVDVLICNAFPQIPAKGFLEQSSSDYLQFIQKSVASTVTLVHELLPLVSKEGTVMLISTRYTRQPEPQFSHYIAAKSCLEGVMRSLAAEFRELKFMIIRPPRMLTDQTNLAFDLSPPVSAVAVGRELMLALGQPRGSSNLSEVDLG